MIERVTDRGREVVVNAQAAAQKCHHPAIDAPHLLLGLLCRADTKGCRALNQAGLQYQDVLITVQGMYGQASAEATAQPLFTAEAKELLQSWVGEALGLGHRLCETAHLALACARPGRLPSLQPLVAGREQAIRDAALAALRRSTRPEIQLNVRPQPAHPERDPQSRVAALQRANQIRTQRARLKRDLRAGERSIHDLLLAPPYYAQTAKVSDVLLALPKCGRARIDRLLAQCGISPRTTLGGLTQRQRDDLVKLLTAET